MTWRHWLSVGLGAFAGGAGAWAAAHLDPSAFTSSRSLAAFALGAAIAGAVGVAHLLQETRQQELIDKVDEKP